MRWVERNDSLPSSGWAGSSYIRYFYYGKMVKEIHMWGECNGNKVI